MADDLLLYPRDASWHRTVRVGGVGHQARALHAPSARDAALAACSSRIMVQSDDERQAWTVEAAGDRACQARGCQAAIRAARPLP